MDLYENITLSHKIWDFHGGDFEEYKDIKTQFVPHRGHITSPLQIPAS
jgi:hypothetical protein